LNKAAKGIAHLPTLLKLASVLSSSERAMKHAHKIPRYYDAKKVNAWSNKLKKYFT
jgi:hypothetical protein